MHCFLGFAQLSLGAWSTRSSLRRAPHNCVHSRNITTATSFTHGRKLSATTTSIAHPSIIAETGNCAALAPCHVRGDDDSPMKCVTFYAKRFWDAAPKQMRDELDWQRNHRPENCWYETEMLSFVRREDSAPDFPYENAVCTGPFPKHLVYWHNFKAAGTTARFALDYSGFPNYEEHSHFFSDKLLEIFPDITWDDYELYVKNVDLYKKQIYERQRETRDPSVGFTFVRSPVQRFLSGLAQVERLNDTAWEVSVEAEECFDMLNPMRKVECVVDSIVATGVFFNVHIYPQAYLFDSWTQQGTYDTAISVLSLKDMDPLLKRFKGYTVERARESAASPEVIKTLHERDLKADLIAKICNLYRMDILMLQTLGMEDLLCAKHVNIE